ncbi:hypothetical protein Cob_v012679 [Colletotrichum orbiculare MAFF 240422]|uniref:Uncharacterized protein n=1 Tax=Colletotrichum orbiculare (strain 104-T / ATCC 96160 / CBS 514.97 / LARS 414 / MAFF 240422) TaxID=1213857 RepID=N4V7Z4_COLOR|nr:hypothetical protein Cob_v012679 [Colletotrichum orbiculare MAFF 240422]
MHSYRGRGGPRQSTPANVQCQKCLKRDMSPVVNRVVKPLLTFAERHYSYECKESSTARPYVSRPSRTQQLLNPKLMPKLTNDTPDDVQRKKGIADEELAKKEAERARKRELEERDDELIRQTESKRRRSASVDSVSTISTNRSVSPPPRRRSPSPVPARRRQRSPEERKVSHRRSLSPESDDGRSRRSPSRQTQSPPRRRLRSPSRDSRSPPPVAERGYRDRVDDRRPGGGPPRGRSLSRESRESSVSRGGSRRQAPSRSPEAPRDRSDGGFNRGSRGGHRGHPARGGGNGPERRREQRQPERERERSLSPFSKRLALTQSLNMGR